MRARTLTYVKKSTRGRKSSRSSSGEPSALTIAMSDRRAAPAILQPRQSGKLNIWKPILNRAARYRHATRELSLRSMRLP